MCGKLYKPIIKEGTHLASSKGTVGAYRGSLLDNKTNILAGQAEWIEAKDDKLGKAVVLLVGIGIGYVVCKAKPHVVSWFKQNIDQKADKMGCQLTTINYIEKVDVVNDIPLCVSMFNNTLKDYLEKVKSDTLDVATIDKLISALNDLKENQESDSIVVTFSLEQLSSIMDIVLSVTENIQRDNMISLKDFQPQLVDDGELVKLQQQLVIQKYILNQTA